MSRKAQALTGKWHDIRERTGALESLNCLNDVWVWRDGMEKPCVKNAAVLLERNKEWRYTHFMIVLAPPPPSD